MHHRTAQGYAADAVTEVRSAVVTGGLYNCRGIGTGGVVQRRRGAFALQHSTPVHIGDGERPLVQRSLHAVLRKNEAASGRKKRKIKNSPWKRGATTASKSSLVLFLSCYKTIIT